MQLPDHSIGISDILAHRECPRRMSFSMKRHTAEGEPPEAGMQHAYGSCIHDILHGIEERDLDEDRAIQLGFDKWSWALEPEDLDLIRHDIETYMLRDILGVRTLAAEGEFKVPLLQHEGQTIYFRFRLDRLYQRLDNAGVFIHVDYKSSKWRKAEAEVHSDLQMWAYNWGIHEFFPECESLVQVYDQLRYGTVPTNKSDHQREQIAEWLRRQVRVILEDEEWQDDGLLDFRFNQWCPYCPIMESCGVVEKLSDFAQTRIAALSKDASAVRKVGLDGDRISKYTDQLGDVSAAAKVLDRYERSVKGLVKELPTSERERLGFRTSDRRSDVWDVQAMRRVHEILGDDFYSIVGITKTRLDEMLSDDSRHQEVLALARRDITGETLRRTT